MESTTKIKFNEDDILKLKEKSGVSCDLNGFGFVFVYGYRSRDFELIHKENLKIKSIEIEYYGSLEELNEDIQ